MQKLFKNTIINKREMCIGIALMMLSLLMPSIFNVKSFGIYPDIHTALNTNNQFYVILAASKLVVLNSIRSLPHYLGAFYIAQSIHIFWKGKKEISGLKTLFICGLIPPIYYLIEKIYHIQYDFGLPAIAVIAMLIILTRVDFELVNLTKKSLTVVMMIMAFQWLDIMPLLAPYPIGRGETSIDIKNAAYLLECTDTLQFNAVLLFLLLFVNSLLLCKLVLDQNHLMEMSEENSRNQRILMETQMRILESRTYMELQNLVHDLKSPLTSVQALVGVVKMKFDDDKRTLNYLTKIENSVERMSSMISEILYEDKRSPITMYDFFISVMAQISASEYSSIISLVNNLPDAYIFVNKTRFSRALINLFENAFYASDKEKGRINVLIDNYRFMDNDCIRIIVSDNGSGIPENNLQDVWKSGYSSKGSLGFGLSFVQKVISDNDGYITLDSTLGEGTNVTILMPYASDIVSISNPNTYGGSYE